MMESNLVEGRQDYSSNELVYGQNITDPCLGWNDTEALLQTLPDTVSTRRKG
jgi:3-deoxy-7-phosphoheptulonate synthase